MSKRIELANKIVEGGFIVKQKFSFPRASRPVSYDSIGLNFSDREHKNLMDSHIRLGYESLLPKKITNEIYSVRQNLMANLNKYSLKTSWGRLVPTKSINRWENENEEYRQNFWEIGRRLCKNYDFIVDEIRSDYTRIAKKKWDNASMIESYVREALLLLPSKEMIMQSFNCSHLLLKISIENGDKEIYSDILIRESTKSLRERVVESARVASGRLRENGLDVFVIKRVKRIFRDDEVLNFFDEDLSSMVNEAKGLVRKRRSEIDIERLTDILAEMSEIATEI